MARHSRVSTTVFPRSVSLRLLFVERAQSTARSASSSCQSRRIDCVSQNVGSSREMFEKTSNAWVLRLKAFRCVPLIDTAQKKLHLTHHLTPWHSPQTPTAPQRQTTRGKTLVFCDASRTKRCETLISSLLTHFFFLTTVPQMEENTM